MIGESPPRDDNFFYLCRGPLFRHTFAVFKKVFASEAVPEGCCFLRWFRCKGCYVEDLCELPTNGMEWGSPERKNEWTRGVPHLSSQLSTLKPLAIFIFVRGSRPHLRRATLSSGETGLSSSQVHTIADGPMPGCRYDRNGLRFETELEKFIC